MTDTATHPVTQGAENVPFFELPDERGAAFDLSDKLSEGPVVVLFYRGDW
jgi:peroxiredoxin